MTLVAQPGRGKSARAPYRSEADVSARLQSLETRRDLLRHQWQGWCVWPLLRFGAGIDLMRVPADASPKGFTRQQKLAMGLKDLIRIIRLGRARLLVKTYSSAHMELEDGRKKDVFFDDLLRATDSCCKIESLNSPRFHAAAPPYLVPPDLTTAGIDGLGVLLARGFPASRARAAGAALAADLVEEPELAHLSASFIAGRIAEFHWAKWVHRMLLRRLGPTWLLRADGGDFAATAAAREMGIHVVELQHGCTHRHSVGSSWAVEALAYKSRMPLPHRVFLYGPYWQRELAANGFWSDELRAVGSTRVDRYRKEPPSRDSGVCTIIVTTQGTDTERLVAFLAEALRHLADQAKYHVVIKMHPLYHASDRAFVEAFGQNPRVQLVASNESPSTFALLRAAHLHISIYSTCHYEALALGVPTIVLPLTGCENVIHLHHAGHAFLPATPAELAEIIVRWREHSVPARVGDDYFTPGALENIQRELAALPARAA